MTDDKAGSLVGKLRSWALDPEEDQEDPQPENSRLVEQVIPVPAPVEDGDRAALPDAPAAAKAVTGKPSLLLRLRLLLVDEETPAQPGIRIPPPGLPVSDPAPVQEPAAVDGPAAVPSSPRTAQQPRGLQKLLSIFSPPKHADITTVSFDPGETSIPSLDGALRDVNITYLIEPPYQYVHIEYIRQEGALVYSIVEPQLSDDEKAALNIIENAFEKLVSTNVELIDATQRENYLHDRFYSLMNIFGLKLEDVQKRRMFFHLKKNYLGYGRIDTLMKDKYIEDISCNGSNMNIYVQHRTYGSIRTNVQFAEVELNNFVLKLAQVSGRHVSLLQPIRDLTLPDGSRANITLGGEVTKKGSTFTIRKFRANPISSIELMDYGSIDAQQLAYTWILMEYKRSILVSGGTATGKTTFLNVLCSFIPPEYKIVSIEDTAELNLMHPNWIQSITRTGFGTSESSAGSSGISGMGGGGSKSPGDISLYDLLVAALRQRPEFIIVGEVRGGEAFTLFQAIAVGHAALGTIHAGSMDELLARVESNPMNVPRSLLSNLDLVIFPMHIKKGERSMRRIANIVEILELDRDKGDLITNTVFKWAPDLDEFKWQGRSFLFDKIRDTYGVSKDKLTTELEDRTRFINWMQKNNIREYEAVTRMVQLYYRDKEEVLRMMSPVQVS